MKCRKHFLDDDTKYVLLKGNTEQTWPFEASEFLTLFVDLFWHSVLTWFGHPINKSRNITRSDLDEVPKVHEGEAKEEAKGAAELGHKGLHGVHQLLLLYQQEGRGVSHHELWHLCLFLRMETDIHKYSSLPFFTYTNVCHYLGSIFLEWARWKATGHARHLQQG